MPAIICDTSPLIFFAKIDKLPLLPDLFGQVWLTSVVAAEYERPLPRWAVVQDPAVLPTAEQVPARFGLSERSAIGLALTQTGCLLIIDDEQPKQAAKRLGLTCQCTLSVLKLAKETGCILLVRLLVEQLRTVGGMWLTDYVAETVCREAGE